MADNHHQANGNRPALAGPSTTGSSAATPSDRNQDRPTFNQPQPYRINGFAFLSASDALDYASHIIATQDAQLRKTTSAAATKTTAVSHVRKHLTEATQNVDSLRAYSAQLRAEKEKLEQKVEHMEDDNQVLCTAVKVLDREFERLREDIQGLEAYIRRAREVVLRDREEARVVRDKAAQGLGARRFSWEQ